MAENIGPIPNGVDEIRDRAKDNAIKLFQMIISNLAVQNETNNRLISAVQQLTDAIRDLKETQEEMCGIQTEVHDVLVKADIFLDELITKVESNPSADFKTIFLEAAEAAKAEFERLMKENEDEEEED
jgi:hypothetical protein